MNQLYHYGYNWSSVEFLNVCGVGAGFGRQAWPVGMTKALAKEFGAHGITSNATVISPEAKDRFFCCEFFVFREEDQAAAAVA